GEMSLVGPRPCMGYEFEHYNQWQRQRFDTLPGLTGVGQVSGKNKTTFSEMIAMDLYYTENKSLWLDLKILMMTIPALLSQLKATRLPPQSWEAPVADLDGLPARERRAATFGNCLEIEGLKTGLPWETSRTASNRSPERVSLSR